MAVQGVQPSGRRYGWLLAGLVVLAVGVAGSVIGASLVAAGAASDSRHAFQAGAGEIASTLQLAVQHEQDLTVSASGFFVDNPTATNRQFQRWATVVGAMERYPELLGIGKLRLVPATHPKTPSTATRPAYCLETNTVWRSNSPVASLFRSMLSPRTDPCNAKMAAQEVPLAQKIRDSGQVGYEATALEPFLQAIGRSGQAGDTARSSLPKSTLIMYTPLYRGGVVPATVAARRGAFIGWVATAVTPDTVLDRALQGHPRTAIVFRQQGGFSNVALRAGSAPGGARSVTVDLGGGWSVRVFGAVQGASVFADGEALLVLVGGIVLSVLLAALLYVLATGRARAMRLVALRTDQLRHQALHDALTRLPNRALIVDRIEQMLARGRRDGTSGAVLFVDLDGFKDVNDTLGHEAGDRLLQAVAARLTVSLREVDTIGRMGGDEFVVLIDGGDLAAAPERVAERVLEVMRQPFEIDGVAIPLTVTTSIGVAGGDRETPGDLLRDADVALYRAKAAGKDCYEQFRPEMQSEVQHRVELEFDLRQALAGEQFRLVYQPIYTLDDLSLSGVEALLRWEHPTLGTIAAGEFIPLLEASGHIIDVGRWVLQQACAQAAGWRARGSRLGVSVNISARQLDRDSLLTHVREALDATGLEPAALTLEVTETALMRDPEKAARQLTALKQMGIKVAIDDFGTGYSSLAYLQQFPADSLKIDRAFTNALASSPESDALIHMLVQLGRDLGLQTLAEGVETTGQIDHLRREHVNLAQGFLLARPLTPDQLETQLLIPAGALAPSSGTPCSTRDHEHAHDPAERH